MEAISPSKRSPSSMQVEELFKDYVSLDILPNTETFYAVKKYLGEKGPFDLKSRKTFTIMEKIHNETNSKESVARIHEAQLALGYGVHNIEFKNRSLSIYYREIGQPVTSGNNFPQRYEKITIYVEPFGEVSKKKAENSNQSTDQQTPWSILRDFVTSALDFNQNVDQDETRIFTVNEQTLEWKLITERPKRPIASVFIKRELKADIVSDIEKFLSSKNFYTSHGIPFRRGYLLYGPPGCGKSSLVSALAGEYNLNICLLQLGHKSVTDNVLANLFMTAPPRSIILVEDIDTIFNERQPVNIDQAVTFSGFINAIDGVGSAEGKIVIITTNNAAKLDQALLRPGRIDKKYKVDYAGRDELEDMFLFYFDNEDKKAKVFAENVAHNYVTTAEVQQHFIKYQNSAEEASKNRFELVDLAASFNDRAKEDDETAENFSLSYLTLW